MLPLFLNCPWHAGPSAAQLRNTQKIDGPPECNLHFTMPLARDKENGSRGQWPQAIRTNVRSRAFSHRLFTAIATASFAIEWRVQPDLNNESRPRTKKAPLAGA
jgi:hypothetical protein